MQRGGDTVQTLILLHDRLATTMTLYALFLGLWGLYKYVRGEGLDGNYLGAIIVAEVLIIVQALLGFALFGGGLRPARLVHILYGIMAVISFPATYAYTRGDDSRRVMLIWGLVGLFVFGLAVRAQMVQGAL
ncbi:hypothetical protein ARMA_2077 [Ardenticatena maritima]|uniref:Cytochrome b561 domain-containing protein n=1 Tax=Ardenticatena maritima TaxID=872965 RepID=A0A0M9UD53_9CHLR|nr:hypothetical protein ARMA_2077 [Ardenticatena maritima]